MVYYTVYASPVGMLTIASNGAAVIGLWIEGQKYFAQGSGAMQREDGLPVFAQVKSWLDRYFAGLCPLPGELPLDPQGSAFQRRVWNILLQIPCGETITYGEIAKRIGCKSAQAVGGAVGHNPVSIVIPCHRVMGADGSLTGYAGGIDKKVWLLRHEGVRCGL